MKYFSRISLRTQAPTKLWQHAGKFAAVAALAWFSPAAQAANVTAFGSQISIPKTNTSGTVLSRYYITPQQACRKTQCTFTNAKLFPRGGLGTATGPVIGTNVTGITTRVLVNGEPVSGRAYPNVIVNRPIEVQLLSNGATVAPGSLAGSFDPPEYFQLTFAEDIYALAIALAGQVTPIAGTCSVPNQTVTLPFMPIQRFSGVGTTMGHTSFAIRLNNCPAGYNRVGYMVTPLGGAEPNLPGVLPLRSGSTAEGFRIKLTNGSDVPVAFDTSTKVTDYSKSTGGSYSIPLVASYLQTDAATKVGKLDSAIQVLLDYQ
ncbi:fimbrial protein [Burkholderia cepacia]|uniref:fimbrial protein n=1 Tax=Burkholderia cepacia TaxID=292 RepID=UPI001CF448C8|nr:fimbrial protein [Burkholderia cepacia]MCA7936099.1 type 1 fimbrial protein [Burkholderia cepacia]